MDENFIVDFGEVTRVTTEDFNKLNNRPSYAGELMTGDTDIPQVPSSVSELNNDSNYQTGAQVSEAIETETEAREAADTALDGRLTTVEGIAATALQPSSIDKVVMTDINVGANTSTTTFNLDASKQNLLTGVTSSKQVSMPVASSTEAGIMNSATFDAVANNTANINALVNGAVAITGLPSSPTQAQLTTAWENATGETSLMNRAGIYDVTNGKVWTYYTNDTTWHSTTNTTQVTINTFTNSSEGTIKGSTNVGQIFAEADGTGSVNGWDALNDAVENNSSDISDLQTAVDGKQDKLIAGANINIAADGKTISATDTTYTAGNAIDITNGEISADIHPADFFTASDSISECGSNLSLDNTIATTLKSVELKGDTYQQTYSGKNLFDKVAEVETSPNYSLNPDGTITTDASNAQTGRKYMTLTMNPGTYTLSFRPYFSGVENPGIRFTIRNIDTSTDYIAKNINNPENGSLQVNSFTVENTTSVGFCIIPQARLEDRQTFYFYDTQLELGSTSTPYEPYTGGISAPNPDYPQAVQTVTGEQTVTVSDGVDSEVFPINLGSTELCKIGDYQDYIYKNGNDWYVHKEVGKAIFDGTESWSGNTSTGSPTYLYAYTTALDSLNLYSVRQAFCSHFSIRSDQLATGTEVSYPCMSVVTPSASTYAHIRLVIPLAIATNTNELRTWLGSHNTNLYYVLATPTDTKITDATLVAQLNALAGGKSYNNQTDIVVTATGENLPAILCVEAYQKSLNGLLGAIERLGA